MGLGGPNDWLGGSRKARAWPPEDGRMTPCAVGREKVAIDALVTSIETSDISKPQICMRLTSLFIPAQVFRGYESLIACEYMYTYLENG